MVRPERRTRGDLVAAAAIAIVVIVAGVLIWWTSDARAASSRPAVQSAPSPAAARAVPQAVTQLWSAASPATAGPVVIFGVVVTGDGRAVHGRDPVTGESRWSYARGIDLCAVSWVYRYAVAVYPDSRGCGQVSAIDAGTGRRGPARSSYADRHVDVTSDGTTVLSAGASRLELWRSDLVRVLSYGEIDARVKPSAQGVGSGCVLLSAAAGSSAVSVLESCPAEGPESEKEQGKVRLALLRAGKDEDEPEVRYVPESEIAAESGARVLAVSGTRTAVYLPSPKPRVEVIDETGAVVASTLLPAPVARTGSVSKPGDLVTWWTGETVLVFDAANLTYRYSIPATDAPLGPAAIMADRLLIPVRAGIGVYDPVTGAHQRTIPVERAPGETAVIPAVSGATVLEQRGDTLVALG
ncbi:MAG TPA: hypothetical protein VFR27_10855 [Mycobacterium sp.]|nr:hypothetical protein [Mycobacterium sp.]